MNQILQRIEELFDEMVAIRRYLHERPELSHEEVHTPAYIAKYLRALGLSVKEGVGQRGVVATLEGEQKGETIALRADFDALAIQEQTDVPYKSKVNGVMHACGHDGHTATLLVVAKVLTEFKQTLKGSIVFIFQHAEELAPGGAKAMIEDGCLDGVDVIYGAHLWAPTDLGAVETTNGPLMAAADRIEIVIEGKGGHGAQPHEAIDPIVASAQFIGQLQTIVSRQVDPLKSAVVSIGHIQAANPFNVIAQQVQMLGTVRTFDETIRQSIEKQIDNVLQGLALSTRISYDLNYVHGYPPLINHAVEAEHVLKVAATLKETNVARQIDPMMIGEDFSYYLQRVKGAFFLVGARDENMDMVYPHHHPKFNFDERAMLHSAKIFLSLVYKQ